MEHKVLIIGGGIAAAVALGVFVIHARNSAAAAAIAQQTSADSSGGYYFSGTIPSAVGYTSSDAQTTTQAGNSGSTATGGGFDISSLLGAIAAGSVQNSAAQVIANQHTADSAILSGINLGNAGGTLAVSHSNQGTTVTVAPSQPVNPKDALLTAEYRATLGRDPDAEGYAWWQNAFKVDSTLTPEKLHAAFVNSDEYKKAHPNG
jgi:hypothetical protein